MLIKATRLHPGVPLQIDEITALAIWCISFLALSLSSTEGHCQSSPLPSTLTSVICPCPLAMMTDRGADTQRNISKELKINFITETIFIG
jgi:hypothetical protein